MLLKKLLILICIFGMLSSLFRLPSYKIQLCYLVLCLIVSVTLVFLRNRNRIVNLLAKVFLTFGLIEIGLLILTVAVHYLFGYLYLQKEYRFESDFFCDKNVMIIVPHEDDDINLTGGIIEEYVKEGSEVRVVFATNGDFSGLGELRLKEAINVCSQMGIKEENVFFLGYGDQWQHMKMSDGSIINHIYNSTEDVIWTSHFSKTETYGLYDHLPYHQNVYTRDNYLSDIKDIILEYRPNIIYVNDYDAHSDHRATSMLFEEAMGSILSETTEYTPVIYKGYCYESAWYAIEDFLKVNIASTQESNALSESIYRWDDRIRIPVDSLAAGRLISQNSVYKALDQYTSQQASQKAGSIINGDKIFWERRTGSLLYSAQISYKNETVIKLNDFKLVDSFDISDLDNIVPEDGVQILTEGEAVEIQLCEVKDIAEVYLYDNPSQKSNILGGYILFDTGDMVEFGALDASGSVTKIECNVNDVKAFSIIITEAEGNAPGLTEIEAYQSVYNETDEYIKIIDDKDNFCYDYWIENEDMQAFTIYSLNDYTDLEYYDLELQGDKECYCKLEENYIWIYCPRGGECLLTVSKNNVSDTIRISNPYTLKRNLFLLIRKFDYDYSTYRNFFTKTYEYYRYIYIRLKYKKRA